MFLFIFCKYFEGKCIYLTFILQVCKSLPRESESRAETYSGPLQRWSRKIRNHDRHRQDPPGHQEVRRGGHLRYRVRDEEGEGVDGAD